MMVLYAEVEIYKGNDGFTIIQESGKGTREWRITGDNLNIEYVR